MKNFWLVPFSKSPIRSSILDLFEEFEKEFISLPLKASSKSFPPINMKEDDSNYYVEIVAPGSEKDNIDIIIEDGQLLISGKIVKNIENKKEKYHYVEYSQKSFNRTIPLPDNCKESDIKAEYKNGIITITIPKEESKKSKKIEITD